MKIIAISDTHNKHGKLINLPSADLIIHAGDISSVGYIHEIKAFLKWFDNVSKKCSRGGVFIAGNHDFYFENFDPEDILKKYNNIQYLQDSELLLYFDGPNGERSEDNIRIYGSPWQPEFCNWAFNLPKNGDELKEKWNLIPENTDILITHGPPYKILDTSGHPYNESGLGCELLRERINKIKPKIHIFGHIHGSYGYAFVDDTHFINASILNEKYEYKNKPIIFDWDPLTNEIEFL